MAPSAPDSDPSPSQGHSGNDGPKPPPDGPKSIESTRVTLSSLYVQMRQEINSVLEYLGRDPFASMPLIAAKIPFLRIYKFQTVQIQDELYQQRRHAQLLAVGAGASALYVSCLDDATNRLCHLIWGENCLPGESSPQTTSSLPGDHPELFHCLTALMNDLRKAKTATEALVRMVDQELCSTERGNNARLTGLIHFPGQRSVYFDLLTEPTKPDID